MYKCERCGFAFDEPEERISRTDIEYWGAMSYEDYRSYHCPECGSEDYEEACECDNCGTFFLPAESPCKCLCETCFDKYTADFDRVYKLFNSEYEMKLNGLVTYLLSEEEINNILHNYVKKHFGMGYCKEFNDFVSENSEYIGESIEELGVIEW